MKLTVKDTARMLGVREDDVYRWIRDKSIPVHRVNDHYRFHRAEVLEWATSRGMRVSSEEFRVGLSEASEQPRFADALAAGGIYHDVGGADRESMLQEVVARMPIEADDRELLYDFLVAREALGSTGVGDGIAIPHVRNPVVLQVAQPSITLCFLAAPVEFGAIDDKPVSVVFSLVSGTIRSHLYLLSRLSAALHDPRFRAVVLRREPKEDILAAARALEEGSPGP
jgi:PTS system nitrogen regulatory IIA component